MPFNIQLIGYLLWPSHWTGQLATQIFLHHTVFLQYCSHYGILFLYIPTILIVSSTYSIIHSLIHFFLLRLNSSIYFSPISLGVSPKVIILKHCYNYPLLAWLPVPRLSYFSSWYTTSLMTYPLLTSPACSTTNLVNPRLRPGFFLFITPRLPQCL